MKCYGCDGEGQPQRLCLSVSGNIIVCNNCRGKENYAARCISKGGGAFKGGSKGGEKGKGKWGASKGGGKSKGKGWPKGKGWSKGGKGKGMYGLDDNQWPVLPGQGMYVRSTTEACRR